MFRWPARNSLHGRQHDWCGFSGDTELRAAGIGTGVDFRTFFSGWHASCGVLAWRNPSFVPGYQRAEQPGHTLTCLCTYVCASQAALTTAPRGPVLGTRSPDPVFQVCGYYSSASDGRPRRDAPTRHGATRALASSPGPCACVHSVCSRVEASCCELRTGRMIDFQPSNS